MKFIKKPEVIEAIQFTGDNKIECIEFTGKRAMATSVKNEPGGIVAAWVIAIRNPANDVFAHKGDWIIKEINGDFSVVGPNRFPRLYKPLKELETEPFPG